MSLIGILVRYLALGLTLKHLALIHRHTIGTWREDPDHVSSVEGQHCGVGLRASFSALQY